MQVESYPSLKIFNSNKYKNLNDITILNTIDITWSSIISNLKNNTVSKISKTHKTVNHIVHEVNILKELLNENIIKFYDILEYNDRFIGFTMENGGISLRHLIMNKRNICKFWIKDILNGLSYLKMLNIIHSDLRPENIVILKNAKIIDFGCAITIGNNPRKLLDPVIEYTSPEYHQYNIITHKFDVFSLGICIWEYESGIFPYNNLNQNTIKENIINFHFDPIPDKVDDLTYKIITLCRKTYEERPDADELIRYIN